jgi:hypothetical protein
MAVTSARRTFTATIARTNGHGFQTLEQPGTWLNLSKFDQPPLVIPPAGTVVRLTLDGSGFVRGIEPADGADLPQPQLPLGVDAAARPSVTTSITRLAVLKAAARLLAGTPDASVDQVLEVADTFERWVERVG